MGNYNVRRKGLLNSWEILACQLTFQGRPDEYIIKQCWPDTDMNNKNEVSGKKRRLTYLRKKPEFLEYYRTILTEFQVHAFGKAMNKIVEQIDNDNQWLANKAANDVLTRASKTVIGEDENAVTVKIQGLPELGTPDSDG